MSSTLLRLLLVRLLVYLSLSSRIVDALADVTSFTDGETKVLRPHDPIPSSYSLGEVTTKHASRAVPAALGSWKNTEEDIYMLLGISVFGTVAIGLVLMTVSRQMDTPSKQSGFDGFDYGMKGEGVKGWGEAKGGGKGEMKGNMKGEAKGEMKGGKPLGGKDAKGKGKLGKAPGKQGKKGEQVGEEAAAEEAKEQDSNEKKGERKPQDGMKFTLLVDVKNGQNMPSVNTFGGCDPFVEVRLVKGDPAQKGGDVEGESIAKGQTNKKDSTSAPEWNESVKLKKCKYDAENFLNIILWDYNVTQNTPIGYQSICITDVLDGLVYNETAASAKQQQKEHVAKFETLLPDKSLALNSTVNMNFSYIEVHTVKINIQKAARLPKVAEDPHIEARICTTDPRSKSFEKTPPSTVVWSSKTKTKKGTYEPEYNESFDTSVTMDPSFFIQFILQSEGTLMTTPIGQVVVPFKTICGYPVGATKESNLLFEKLAGYDEPPSLSKASLAFSVSHSLDTSA